MQIIKSSEKKKIVQQLNEQFGIGEIRHLLLRFGKEKIRAFSGNLSTNEILTLDTHLRIESAGVYLAKEQEDGIRLTIDGISLFKEQITKNILELTEEQAQEWFKGRDLMIQSDKSFKILKYKEELIGCGKSTGERIVNFMPKERRIKG